LLDYSELIYKLNLKKPLAALASSFQSKSPWEGARGLNNFPGLGLIVFNVDFINQLLRVLIFRRAIGRGIKARYSQPCFTTSREFWKEASALLKKVGGRRFLCFFGSGFNPNKKEATH
jgi:hypothetical protein